jgi:hypothetical protein
MAALKALFDTNILIDYFNGIRKAKAELDRFRDRAISIVTWMEVLAGAPPAREEETRSALAEFPCLLLTPEIADRAVALRRGNRIKLPDAIIWATAETTGRILVTRNHKDFPREHPGVRIPYQI